MTLYETLGVSPDATPAAMKTAYRSLAQKNHPDKGGDKEVFQRIQEAYAVLSDEAKRAQYDQTGEVPGNVPTPRENAMQIISQVLDKILDQIDPDYSNLVGEIEGGVRSALDEIADRTARTKGKLAKVASAMRRIQAKAGKEDAITPVLEHFKQRHTQELAHIENQNVIFTAALEIIREHKYSVDPRPAGARAGQFGSSNDFATMMNQAFAARGFRGF